MKFDPNLNSTSSYFISKLNIYEVQLTLFDIGFFEPSVTGEGGGHEGPHHNFVVIAPMIMKFGIIVKLDVFYTMVTKKL